MTARSRTWQLLAAVSLIPVTAWAETVAVERAQVEQKLVTKKAALELLQTQRVEVLEVLELVEKLAAGLSRRTRALEAELALLGRRVQLAERQEALARGALEERLADLSPRLFALYRLLRQSPLQTLSSAEDLSALLRRFRALARLLRGDLAELREVRQASDFERRSLEEVNAVKASLATRLSQLKAQRERAVQERRDLADLLELIRAEAIQSRRSVRELEHADRELSRLLAAAQRLPAQSGFAALKGQLPLPADGAVEVGFGRLVNPRFGTTTVQRGWDIRAAPGTPVRAVAEGRVVYSGWLRGYGKLAIIDHGDGYHSLMAHLGELSRELGDVLEVGDEVGVVGDTGSLKGPYLYFELRQDGQAIDPAPWLKKPR